MLKKIAAGAGLAIVIALSAPLAANAVVDPYVPDGNITVSDSTPAPGGVTVITFSDGSFSASEPVEFSVTGEGAFTLSAISAVSTQSITKTTSPAGGVTLNVQLSGSTAGGYSVTGTGTLSGIVGTASFTVTPADADPDGLATTGSTVSVLAIWIASGAVLLGIALVIVMNIVRKQRLNA